MPIEPFYLLIKDRDTNEFNIVGPMTDAAGKDSPVPQGPGIRTALDDFDSVRNGRVSHRASMRPTGV